MLTGPISTDYLNYNLFLFEDVLNLRELARASNIQANRLNESTFGCDFDRFAEVLSARFVDRYTIRWPFNLFKIEYLLSFFCRTDVNTIFSWAHLGQVICFYCELFVSRVLHQFNRKVGLFLYVPPSVILLEGDYKNRRNNVLLKSLVLRR